MHETMSISFLAILVLIVPIALLVVVVMIMRKVFSSGSIRRQVKGVIDEATDAIDSVLDSGDPRDDGPSRQRKEPPAPAPGGLWGDIRGDARGEGGGSKPKMDFVCDHCGAAADGALNISPSGDVQCDYCGKWFSVHV